MTRQTNHTNDPYPMDALLPFNASGLFAGVDASFSLPPGTSLLLVAGLSIIIPLSLVACGKKGVPSLSVRKRDTVLLLGECKAGKTVLFHQVCKLFADAEDPAASRLRFVDFPGHHRLSRAPFRALDTILGGVKCIIIVLDASDTRGAYLRDVSELLYDVLTHPPIADASPSILIACNKQDVPGAVSPAAISKRLEDELERMKTSKVAVSATGDTGEKVLLGVPGQRFTFAADAPNVTFSPASATTGNIGEVLDFIRSA